MKVIGVDCATDNSKVGVALGEREADDLRVLRVEICSKERYAAFVVAEWLDGAREALLAIDAPLGWPASLAPTLSTHMAGSVLTAAPNDMFRRETDRFVQRRTGKTPLDVGADRIARTAHAALDMLHKLRKRTEKQIPLAWNLGAVADTAAIEVYPAATLAVHGFRSSGYKEPQQVAAREEIVRQLADILTFPGDTSKILTSADALDAVVCLLAAKDFLDESAMRPENLELAQREGWIWVARPKERIPDVRTPKALAKPQDIRADRHVASPEESQGTVIMDVSGLSAADVARKRVLCPACGLKTFESWPAGWDRHAEVGCAGLQSKEAKERKAEFKRRFRHLFR